MDGDSADLEAPVLQNLLDSDDFARLLDEGFEDDAERTVANYLFGWGERGAGRGERSESSCKRNGRTRVGYG